MTDKLDNCHEICHGVSKLILSIFYTCYHSKWVMDEVPFPAPLSSQPKTDDKGEVNINFKIPLALKQETKSFCVAKNIKFKDFAAYALKMAIVKHSKPKPESSTLKAQISDGTTTLHT